MQCERFTILKLFNSYGAYRLLLNSNHYDPMRKIYRLLFLLLALSSLSLSAAQLIDDDLDVTGSVDISGDALLIGTKTAGSAGTEGSAILFQDSGAANGAHNTSFLGYSPAHQFLWQVDAGHIFEKALIC